MQNQNIRKKYNKTGAGAIPIRERLNALDLVLLDLVGVEPCCGIPNIQRAPVLPGEEELLATPKKLPKNKPNENPIKALRDSVVTPSLTHRKIVYSPDNTGKKKNPTHKKEKKKHKKKRKVESDDSDAEVSSTTSEPPVQQYGAPLANPLVDLTSSPLTITGML